MYFSNNSIPVGGGCAHHAASLMFSLQCHAFIPSSDIMVTQVIVVRHVVVVPWLHSEYGNCREAPGGCHVF